MWRKPLIQVGEFLKGLLTLKTLSAIYTLAGGGYTFINAINVYSVGEYKTPFQIAFDVFITVLWLILFYVLTYIIVQTFCNSLISLGKWYPDFWYLPKINILAKVTKAGEIELVLTNKKNQRFTLAAGYHLLESSVDPLPDQAWGVAPDSKKQLLPLDTMTGKDRRSKKIGKISNGIAVLSAGDSNGEMILEKPGTYQYWVKWYGEFRSREYEDRDKITIRVTEKSGVIIDR